MKVIQRTKKMKEKTLELTKDFVLAILAGVAISIGGVAFLASSSKIAGAIFFTVGLFMVCTLSLNLFTGKVGFALEKPPIYCVNLLVIWLGNLVGAVVSGYLIRATRISNTLVPVAESVVSGKINDSFLSIFVLAIFCNILIFLAVYGFNKFESPLLKVLALFFGVSVFVLAGFEHCVANMFYFSIANAWCDEAVLCIVATTLGNIVGALFLPICFKFTKWLENKKESK